MAILKAHNSFLRANGKLLKSKDSKLPYELNINNFDASTLTDGILTWRSNAIITNEGNAIKIRYDSSSGSKYFATTNLLDLIDIENKYYTIEYDISLPNVSVNYAGIASSFAGNVASLCNTPYCNAGMIFYLSSYTGFWTNASLNYSSGMFLRYKLSSSMPKNVKIKFNPVSLHAIIYIDGSKTFECYLPTMDQFYITINNGSNEAKNCSAYLYSLKIYSE